MAPYALPLPPHQLANHSKRLTTPSANLKRKRSTSPVNEGKDSSPTSTPFDNPLALTPAEITQYRLAGLPLDQELPTALEPDFPHRSVPDPQRIEEEKQRRRSQHELKKQNDSTGVQNYKLNHLEVLVTILMRCLEKGDIGRASKAWALLLRSTVSGHAIELRESGFWGIGAELLIRAGEDATVSDDPSASGNKSWGTDAGLRRVKSFYERLILQYPFKRQYADSMNALDFWPAMIGCEVYGIQETHSRALSALQREEEDVESEEFVQTQEPITQEGESMEEAHDRVDQELRRTWRRRRRDEIRLRSLEAMQRVAAELDKIMDLPPYSEAQALLRLRGMISLSVGDLHVPAEGEEDEGLEEDDEYRMMKEQGLRKRKEERATAKKLFDQIKNGKGIVIVGDIPEIE